MKKLLLLPVLALGLLFPGATHASIAVTWLATSTDAGYTQPAPVNGNNPFLKILSISTSTFSNGINITTGCFSVGGVCIGSGSGAVSSVFGRTGAVVATAGDYTTALVTEVTNLYFTNARAIAATLTGFSATTGTITSSDSILVALEKLAGNAATYLTNVTGLVTPGTNVTISGSGTSGSPYVINATGGSTGLATSSPIASSNLLEYSSTGAGSAFGVATSTLSASSPLTGSFTQIGSGGALGIQAASASQNGYLSLTDYQLLHTATTTFTSPIIYTAGTNAVTCQTATGSVPGCLSAADWTTFNGKAGANYFTLTGNNLQNNTGNALGINTAPTIAALEVQASSTTGNAFTAWSAGGANLFSILNGGNVGVGSSTPFGLFSINPNGLPAGVPQFVIGSSTGTSLLVKQNGDIGIGTASPNKGGYSGETLTLTSESKGAGTGVPVFEGVRKDSNSSTLEFLFRGGNTSNATLGGFAVYSGSTANSGEVRISTDPDGSGLVDRLYVEPNGNIGIGTSTPGTILSIGNTGANTINISNTATSTFGFPIKSNCFTTDGTTCITGAGGSGTVGSGTTGQTPYYAANGTTLTATSSLFIGASGSIGIGTTSPASSSWLSVGSTTYTAFSINKLTGQVGIGCENTGATKWTFGCGSNLNVNPNINLLVTDPLDARLGVAVNNAGVFMKAIGHGIYSYDYTAGGPDPLILQEFGSTVGIGVASPVDTLDIQGGLNLATNSTVIRLGGQNFIYASSTNKSTVLGLGADGNEATTSASGSDVAIGFNAMHTYNSTSFGGNVAVGEASLVKITSGGDNVAIGMGALGAVTTALSDTAIGEDAGLNMTGSSNTVIGQGTDQSQISGSFNTIIGSMVNAPVLSGSQQLNIGNVLYGTSLYNVGSASSVPTIAGRIGIGTTTPAARLSVQANSGDTNTLLFMIGSTTAASVTSTFMSVNNQGSIQFGALGTGAGNGAACLSTLGVLTFDSGANCITSTPLAKYNIHPISDSQANEVLQLSPVQYNYYSDGSVHYGFIADAATQKIDPSLVVLAQVDTNVIGAGGKTVVVKAGQPLSFDYERYTGLLTAFVQNLSKRQDAQQEEIDVLQTEVATLERGENMCVLKSL